MSESWLQRSWSLFCFSVHDCGSQLERVQHTPHREITSKQSTLSTERGSPVRDRERTRQDFNGLSWRFDGKSLRLWRQARASLELVTCYVLSPGEIHFPPSALCTYKHRSVRVLQINWSNVVDNIVISYEEAIPVYCWIGNKAWSILVLMIENIRFAISSSFMFAVIRIKLSSGLLADGVGVNKR